jgi:hypothetical protein
MLNTWKHVTVILRQFIFKVECPAVNLTPGIESVIHRIPPHVSRFVIGRNIHFSSLCSR